MFSLILLKRRLTRAAVAIACVCGLSGCQSGVLDPRGPVSSGQEIILLDAVAIMLAVIVPTMIVALVFAWWYRDSNTRARYIPNFVHSGKIEFVVWSIPTLVIMFLGGLIWIGSHELDPARPLPARETHLDIGVVSLDWKWLFIYPDANIATVNQLTVPVGTSVHLYLTSAGVMNSFFIPQLAGMIATMPHMVTQLYFEADQPGDYHGLSTQFSGDGFPDMGFTVHAVPADQFGTWLVKAESSPKILDRRAYLELQKQSRNVPPSTWRLVDPELFRAIVNSKIPPAPGPQITPEQAISSEPPGG